MFAPWSLLCQAACLAVTWRFRPLSCQADIVEDLSQQSEEGDAMSVPMQQAAMMELEDELLVVRLRELVGEVDDMPLMDAIYCGLDELLERVAPELLRRSIWRELEDEGFKAAERAQAMDALVAAIEERAALRPLAQELSSEKPERLIP